MRFSTQSAMLIGAILGGALVAGCSSSVDDASSASQDAARYVVRTSAPDSKHASWTGVGTTLGGDNSKALAVPTALVGVPVTVCWKLAGYSNSLETADGTDDLAQANGREISADDGTLLTRSGCTHSFTLSRYIVVTPTGDWTITVAVELLPPSTSPGKPTPSKKAHHPKAAKTHHPTTQAPPSEPVDDEPSSSEDSCYPLTNGGNCYEPGEFCRHSDEGVEGRSGSGETIVCEDNNGLRWDPA